MSLDTSSKIFIAIILIGIAIIIYFLVKDRIDIIRSIKPKSIGSFFGLDRNSGFISSALFVTIINTFALVVWVLLWVLGKYFKLNIFEENNKKNYEKSISPFHFYCNIEL